MPVGIMRNVLTAKEYNGWVRYLAFKTPDETEVQLARLGHMVAQGLGAKDVKLDDFLVNTVKKPTSAKAEESNTPDGVLSQNQVMSVFAGLATPLEG